MSAADRKPVPVSERQFVVVIRGTRRREWGRYLTFAEADDQARALAKHGFDAHVETDDAEPEAPEHNGERRRFLCWAVMCGFAKPERLTERVLQDVAESEALS